MVRFKNVGTQFMMLAFLVTVKELDLLLRLFQKNTKI
jgi:hypothetical protein